MKSSLLKRPISRRAFLGLGASAVAAGAATALSGCGDADDGKVHIEAVCYKTEAVDICKRLQDKFNATHDDIVLSLTAPNDAVTILRTRFVREDYPDIIGIGGDNDYAMFVSADIFHDMSDYPGMENIRKEYIDIDRGVTYVPMDGIYGVPYAANAAGFLYNKEMFRTNGWQIPTTWDELTELFRTIQDAGTQPLYLSYKDGWTILSPWNSIGINLLPSDLAYQVNAGRAKFSDYYREPAELLRSLNQYAEDNLFGFGYDDASINFANGDAAMWPIGSFAVPQIMNSLQEGKSIDVGMFPTPSAPNADDRLLLSGVDLQWCVCEASEKKDAAYEVIDFLLEDDNLQEYLLDQRAIPCKEGNFELDGLFDDTRDWIDTGKIADYLDHQYPRSMDFSSYLQTFMLDDSPDAVDNFLKRWDNDWPRYNEDIIAKVQAYEQEHGSIE